MPIHALWLVPFLGLMILGAIAAVIVLVVHLASQQPRVAPPLAAGAAAPQQREGPLDILARRFASGDITGDEYENAKKLLTDS